MKNIYVSVLAFFLFPISLLASDDAKFIVNIIDYSHSWTSSIHYTFNNELCVVEVDNINKNQQDTLAHRQLLGYEKERIAKYIGILGQIPFQEEYVNRRSDGERNQKRITVTLNGKETSILVVNTYQQDIANFITFLNSFLTDKYKMKEFVDTSKPIKKSKL